MSKKDDIIAQQDKEIQTLRQALKDLNTSHHDMSDELAHTKATLEMRNAQIHNQAENLRKLQHRLTSEAAEHDRTKVDLADVKQELAISRRDLKALKADYETQYVRTCKLADELADATKFERANAAEALFNKTDDERIRFEAEYSEMKDRVKISDEVIAELRAEHSRLEKEAFIWRERFEANERLAKQSAALAESRLVAISRLVEKNEQLKKELRKWIDETKIELGMDKEKIDKEKRSYVRIKQIPQLDGTYIYRVERRAVGIFADYWRPVDEYRNESTAKEVAKRIHEQINKPIIRYLHGTSDKS